MKTRWPLVLAVLAFAGTAAAQIGRDRDQELVGLERRKSRAAAEVDRLVDRRLRLDLGLPVGEDPTLRSAAPLSPDEFERRGRELRDLEGATKAYQAEYGKLLRQLEALREKVQEQTAASNEKESFIDMPSTGSVQSTGRDTGAGIVPAAGRAEGRPPEEGVSARSETATSPPVIPAVRTGRILGQIHGSKDHLRVAQALFRAGQQWMDYAEEARRTGDAKAARERDDHGKERLERALLELEPLLSVEEPEFAALFCQGRCRELLFRYSVRYEGLSLKRSARVFQQREQKVRDPFLAISARDVVKTGKNGEVEVLGPWGKAAESALEHFRWMNLHADLSPSVPIDSLTWPGESDR